MLPVLQQNATRPLTNQKSNIGDDRKMSLIVCEKYLVD